MVLALQHGDEGTGTWTVQEHERFLAGIAMYPNGPWKSVAAIVKTRTVRQLRTHAQKYREKLARRDRRVRGSSVSSPSSTSSSFDEPEAVEDVEFDFDPIAFTRPVIQTDDCLEFLLDAFGQVEFAL
ncbi:Aste57867_9391 [Aphanomyces stellatus]|uniref:Aste57867_9391 protein n=1 Tax=Aphanomyces stellatus TaxID=120398 RepID=A0A485KN35_9STRA|nr:hypothetical protein As57867_009355 [Aphanomyces stellatus]VFT86271.1 Aste57867_9391 [Aphanomyces stellatus]